MNNVFYLRQGRSVQELIENMLNNMLDFYDYLAWFSQIYD